jgi:hypothetical protein
MAPFRGPGHLSAAGLADGASLGSLLWLCRREVKVRRRSGLGLGLGGRRLRLGILGRADKGSGFEFGCWIYGDFRRPKDVLHAPIKVGVDIRIARGEPQRVMRCVSGRLTARDEGPPGLSGCGFEASSPARERRWSGCFFDRETRACHEPRLHADKPNRQPRRD